jgi:hypothetical protein
LPNQPSVNRGTLILLAPDAKDAAISAKNVYFVFQFNPEKLLHTFNQALPSALGTNASAADQQGAPTEFFSLTFELDSSDVDSPSQNTRTSELGLHPALAMLELMMQPQVKGKQTFMPIVVFKWGLKRSLPVRLVSMSTEEKTFDATLNPTRVNVTLTLKVLDTSEIGSNAGARSVSLNHQNVRATLVDTYKLQTGQATVQPGGDALGVSPATAASGSKVASKTVGVKA